MPVPSVPPASPPGATPAQCERRVTTDGRRAGRGAANSSLVTYHSPLRPAWGATTAGPLSSPPGASQARGVPVGVLSVGDAPVLWYNCRRRSRNVSPRQVTDHSAVAGLAVLLFPLYALTATLTPGERRDSGCPLRVRN